MKLLFVLLFATLSYSAFAQWRLPSFGNDSTGGLRAVWSCQTSDRGEMPAEKEVEIYYDEYGTMKFRPDIFRMKFNPLNEINKLIGRRRGSSDVDQCLRTFINTIPQAIRTYQATQCEGLTIPTCARIPAEIITDVQSSLRSSPFYNRYQSELADVAELNPRPITSTPEVVTVPEVKPEVIPEVEVTPETEVTETEKTPVEPSEVPSSIVQVIPARPVTTETARQEVPRPQADVDRARTRLLDYMSDNAARIDRLKDFGNFCPNLGETTGPNANYCRQTMQYNTDLLTRMSQMFTAVRGEPVSVSRVVQSLECVPLAVNEFADIEGILRRLDKKEECAPLPSVGDFKLFKKTHGPPSWYTTGNYLLKKTGDNTYEATMALEFRNLGGSATTEEMMASVKSCLGTVNPYLKGPGGEKISLRALTRQEANEQLPPGERPAVDQINIQPDGIAIDSQNFTGKADCPTIAHELLHHLGLCDEYRETRTNIVSGMSRSRVEEWSCRNVPAKTSIMKNHVEAFNSTIPQQFTCECQNETCRRSLSSSSPAAVAQRKILMTASSGAILGMNASRCVQTYLPTTTVIPDPEKAFTDVNVSGGRLTFQQRSVIASGNQFLTSRANVTCSCPAEDADCPAAFARAAGFLRENPQTENCPWLTRPVGQKTAASPGASTTSDGNSFTVVTTPKNESLLTPSHFDKILTGSCMTSPSSLYKQCSEYAYISQDSAACANKPASCSDDNLVFGVTPQ